MSTDVCFAKYCWGVMWARFRAPQRRALAACHVGMQVTSAAGSVFHAMSGLGSHSRLHAACYRALEALKAGQQA
jgi:hypothetical protein